jgi:hypothetical protein
LIQDDECFKLRGSWIDVHQLGLGESGLYSWGRPLLYRAYAVLLSKVLFKDQKRNHPLHDYYWNPVS